MHTPSLTAENLPGERPAGFAWLDEQHTLFAPTDAEIALYGGSVSIADPTIVETPADILEAGRILTNSSQIERVWHYLGRNVVPLEIAFFREEKKTEHLGTTVAVPYIVVPNDAGGYNLTPYLEGTPVEGEDLRLTPGVRMKGHLGVHEGWQASTIHATADPNDPTLCTGIKQVFYWGETLGTLEPVAVDDSNRKNTTLTPAYTSDDDTTLDGFGRPFPHISYFQVSSLDKLTPAIIDDAIIITEGLIIEGMRVHCGVNRAQRRTDRHVELDVHEAYRELQGFDRTGREINALHYRLGRYGYEKPSTVRTRGRLVVLGTVAERSQFPEAPAKPPEGEVGDYTNILYGAVGSNGKMIVGAGDTTIVAATVVRNKQ